MPTAKRKRRTAKRRRPKRGLRRWRKTTLQALAVVFVLVGGYTLYLNGLVLSKFQGKRWALPAHVYARPLSLYPGLRIQAQQLEEELRALGYRPVERVSRPGLFSRHGSTYHIATRGFDFWDGREDPREIRLVVRSGQLAELTDLRRPAASAPVRLEPLRIGGIYPTHREDRVLVRLQDVPPLLPAALLAVEDRDYYDHAGISLRAIARALWANVRAGGVVQGGSTLTQQLVKNYFLSSERTLWRKLQEAIMALLLEFHYDKQEILQAYLNEVHLGQHGDRAIHGFGLASHFYFAQPLEELDSAQLALLVALVRGPSYYNPRRHPERALARRNRVLAQLQAQGIISPDTAADSAAKTLQVTPRPPLDHTRFPAFLDLVRRQLQRDYREQDLTSEGLRIFTTLDPMAQRAAERALSKQAERLEKGVGLPASQLEGAVILTTRAAGEVLAVVGGRRTRFAGFNRALDALRPVGSLIKPAIYVAALASGHYTLATLVDDSPLQLKGAGGRQWAPKNYDRLVHGRVPLYLALAESYNLATARLGLDVGLAQVLHTLKLLGIRREVPAYPAMLLGAVNLTPIEVTQMYQTLASGGFRMPLRAIREVLTADGTPIARYPLSVKQVIASTDAYLITTALQQVVRSGTARGLLTALPPALVPAGKTGTTDDLRDSWFAGFTSDYLALVWLGRDDNQSARLTGASGAMQVWAKLMQAMPIRELRPIPPNNIEYAWIDRRGMRSQRGCEGAVELPFRPGTAPRALSECASGGNEHAASGPLRWVKGLFHRRNETPNPR